MSNVSTEEGLREFLEVVAEGEKKRILENEMPPKFLWFDTENCMRLLMLPDISVERRGQLAWALKVLTAAQAADGTLIYAFDGYDARPNAAGHLAKHNGEPWGYGGLQEALENQTVDADLVGECLNLTAAQNGWVAMVSLPYKRTSDAIVYDWDAMKVLREDPDNPMGSYSQGDFPSMLREATAMAPLDEAMFEQLGVTPENVGIPPNIARLHMICAAVKFVGQSTGFQCAIPASSEEEAEVLNRSFGEHARMFNAEGDLLDAEGNVIPDAEPAQP